MTPPAARRTQWRLPAVLLAFALASVLWFGFSLAVTTQLIVDGSMRDQVHLIFGYVDAAVEAATVAGCQTASERDP
ncbi:hypothetical protein OPKNFCMD_6680 [Methylobacterium crusticola]|uniref:Uncharacterized protein n=1 Tax=Methylobacterium crusticola TaxID=1697972 RepID=A0ABQ4RAV8_9HYPH|nr:hypothetical protein OPKNFCMD_6680 [Methylobacterium crusticola]